MRMGGSKIIPIDVRIIAATNKDLKKKLKKVLLEKICIIGLMYYI